MKKIIIMGRRRRTALVFAAIIIVKILWNQGALNRIFSDEQQLSINGKAAQKSNKLYLIIMNSSFYSLLMTLDGCHFSFDMKIFLLYIFSMNFKIQLYQDLQQ